MASLLPLLVLGGGLLYVWRRSRGAAFDTEGKPAATFDSKDLVTEDELTKRFESHLVAYKKALLGGMASFSPDQEKIARESFFGDDDRDRAAAMAEFGSGGNVSDRPGAKESRDLAIDYRDKFVLLGKKKERVDELLLAVIDYAGLIQSMGSAEALTAARRRGEEAMVKLIVDSPYVASSPASLTPFSSPANLPVVFQMEGKEPISGTADFDPLFTLHTYGWLSFIIKVVSPIDAVGRYAVLVTDKKAV